MCDKATPQGSETMSPAPAGSVARRNQPPIRLPYQTDGGVYNSGWNDAMDEIARRLSAAGMVWDFDSPKPISGVADGRPEPVAAPQQRAVRLPPVSHGGRSAWLRSGWQAGMDAAKKAMDEAGVAWEVDE